MIGISSYRNENPYPFCPGCGHGSILDSLNAALVRLALDPARTVIVSDIGCSGLSDQYFSTNAFHGLHGRSVTYATGIKLVDPELTVIVIMGDGGTGIGGTHLLSAARRNIGVTVLVMNNFNFGMTGGQHSTTTPEGAVTSTTPDGNLEHPLDICGTVGVNGAGYVYRGTNFDDGLVDRMVEAISHPGFALLDIWDMCTAYFVRSNKLTRRSLETAMGELESGVLFSRDVSEYSASYRAVHAADRGRASGLIPEIRVAFASGLDRRFLLTAAGAAGARVKSASRLVGEAAIRSGLWASQRDDYPVTVKTGHSISQVLMGPAPSPLAPAGAPDALVLLAPEGLEKARRVLSAMEPGSTVFALPEFRDVETRARKQVVELPRISKAAVSLAALAHAVQTLGLFPVEALRESARQGPFADANLSAIEAGLAAVS